MQHHEKKTATTKLKTSRSLYVLLC